MPRFTAANSRLATRCPEQPSGSPAHCDRAAVAEVLQVSRRPEYGVASCVEGRHPVGQVGDRVSIAAVYDLSVVEQVVVNVSGNHQWLIDQAHKQGPALASPSQLHRVLQNVVAGGVSNERGLGPAFRIAPERCVLLVTAGVARRFYSGQLSGVGLSRPPTWPRERPPSSCRSMSPGWAGRLTERARRAILASRSVGPIHSSVSAGYAQ